MFFSDICFVHGEPKINKVLFQALLDDKLLIEFPADTYMHILNHGLDLRNIHNVIITHSHADHFYPNDFWCRFEGIAYDIVEEPLNIYVTEAGYNEALRQLGEDMNENRMDSRHEKDAREVKNYQNILFLKSKWYLRVVNRAWRQEYVIMNGYSIYEVNV